MQFSVALWRPSTDSLITVAVAADNFRQAARKASKELPGFRVLAAAPRTVEDAIAAADQLCGGSGAGKARASGLPE